ncbi:hypothetical protein Droror1_Dr00012089 [Drosera rotundifolia]
MEARPFTSGLVVASNRGGRRFRVQIGVDLGFDDGGDSIESALKMGFETRGDLGFRLGLGKEEACGGCSALGCGVGERKEDRKRRRKEGRKRRRKEEDGAGDLCRRG